MPSILIRLYKFCLFSVGILLLLPFLQAAANQDLSSLVIEEPFRLDLFAKVPKARSMAVASEIQTVFIGTRGRTIYAWHKGKVFRLSDQLNVPNGVAWQSPFLYVAEQDKISRYRFNQFQATLPQAQLVFQELPDKRHHGWRYITIDKKWLYVAIGAPCNICMPKGLEGTIIRLAIDVIPPFQPEIIARGVRNSVGIDIHPVFNRVYFTDNGADHMGDDLPKEELNHIVSQGGFFGYPWYGGGKTRTRQFLDKALPEQPIFPIAEFPAHNAPLGIHFYDMIYMPSLKGKALVALHGSWNRSIPDGYRVMLLDFAEDGTVRKQKILIDGFLSLKGRKGRPVDIKTLWDGRILISDDSRGSIYVLDKNERKL